MTVTTLSRPSAPTRLGTASRGLGCAPAQDRQTCPVLDPGVLVGPGQPFAGCPLPDGVEPVTIRVVAGELTALHAAPQSRMSRGTALLVPGLAGSKEDFAPLLAVLAGAGWDAWAYSQRGQADSVAPAGAQDYRLDDFSRDAVEIAEVVGVGSAVHLVGQDMGGVVAQVAVMRAPYAFFDLALLGAGLRGLGGHVPDLRRLVAEEGSLGLWQATHPGLVGTSAASFVGADSFRRERAARTSDDHLRGALEILWDRTDRTAAMRESGVPVLLARGEKDQVWPQPVVTEMAAALGAQHQTVPGASCNPGETNPVATAAMLDAFWSR